jgi:hypothetical protein
MGRLPAMWRLWRDGGKRITVVDAVRIASKAAAA